MKDLKNNLTNKKRLLLHNKSQHSTINMMYTVYLFATLNSKMRVPHYQEYLGVNCRVKYDDEMHAQRMQIVHIS